MRLAAHIVFLLCYLLPGFTQEPAREKKQRHPYLQLNAHTGSFWTRSEYLVEQFDFPYKAIEARFGYQLTGTELWHQYHRYPKYGFGMHYSDLVKERSDTIVGNPFSLFGFYSNPFFRFGRFTLASDLSAGLSYTGIIYDSETNPLNDVIASHINVYFDLNLNLNLRLTPQIGLNAGYGITHYSNGRIHMPQKGVNNWGWTFGMNWLLKEPVKEYIYREPPEFKKEEAIQVMYAIGIVEGISDGTTTELQFFTSSLTVDYVYQYSPKSAITIGMDLMYDGSLKRSIKGVEPEYASTWQQMYLASHMGCHFIVDRVTLLFNFGTYFRQSSFDRGIWFVRAGGRYRFTERFYGQVTIKSKNGMRSDWIEWGCAYSFKIR